MKEYKRGMKAGIVSGFISFIIGFFMQIPGLLMYYNDYYYDLNFEYFLPLMIFGSFIVAILMGIIGGLIIGLIYAYFYDRLPTKKSRGKALILSLIIWFIFAFIPYLIVETMEIVYVVYNATLFIAEFIQYCILGLLLGTFWDKFSKKRNSFEKSTLNQIKKQDLDSKSEFSKSPYNSSEQIVWSKEREKINEIRKELKQLKEKYPLLNDNNIDEALESLNIKHGEDILKYIKNKINEFEESKKDLSNLQQKIRRLTDRLADGELDSEAYKRASNDLEIQKSDLEEHLWKLRNELFNENYEKPF